MIRTKQGAKNNVGLRAQPCGDRLNPGDKAVRGTPGTGEDVCPHCQRQRPH